jgi:hypothetical protein
MLIPSITNTSAANPRGVLQGLPSPSQLQQAEGEASMGLGGSATEVGATSLRQDGTEACMQQATPNSMVG